MKYGFVGLVFVLTAACGGAVQQIELKGKNDELVKLAGDWEGKFEGIDSGRSGKITFSFELGRHTAEGEVLMDPALAPLKVSFVRVKGSAVMGQLEPYTDPRCKCTVQTEFLGTVEGNMVDGSFTTRPIDGGPEQHGNWSMSRKDG